MTKLAESTWNDEPGTSAGLMQSAQFKIGTAVAARLTLSGAALLGSMSCAQAALPRDTAEHYLDVGALATGADDAAAAGENAVAVGPNASASATASIAIGDRASTGNPGAIAIGYLASASGWQSMALGANANANGGENVSVGPYSVAGAEATTSLGYAARATRNAASVVGSNAEANGMGSSAFGAYAFAIEDADIALGFHASASGGASIATGPRSRAAGAQSIAVGAGTLVTADQAVAFGAGAFVSEANSVALGAASIAAPLGGLAYVPPGADASVIRGFNAVGQVSIGSAGNERRLTHVAAGANDTDAVNVSQLKALQTQVDGGAAALDSALSYARNADGSIDRHNVTLGGDPVANGSLIHNVANGVDAGDAVNLGQLNAAISGAVSNIAVNDAANGTGANPLFGAAGDPTASAVASGTLSVAAGASAQASGTGAVAVGATASATGSNATALGVNSSASGSNAIALGATANANADNSVALGQGSVANRAGTVSVGSAGQERQIANVAAGVQGTDAVNVNQLQQSMGGAISQANGYTDDQIRSARRDAYGGAAAALAVAGLPQAVLPGRGMVAMAGGTYGGQSAIAIGVSQLSQTGKWVYKVQGTTDSRGQIGASLGAGMHW